MSPAMSKKERYERVIAQLMGLFEKTSDPIARMATAAALLKGKMNHFFWAGFYRLVGEDLLVGPYQGSLACQVLARHTGVCWAAVDRGKTVVVPDVEKFPGHIACDSRSKSEIAVPVRDTTGAIVAVLDVDATVLDAFDAEDANGLEQLAKLIYRPLP